MVNEPEKIISYEDNQILYIYEVEKLRR